MPTKANFGAGMVNSLVKVRNDTNTAWLNCITRVRNDANTAWLPVSAITVTASPASFGGNVDNGTFTAGITASVTGGSGSYTYSWAIVASDGGSPGFSAPTSASTNFSVSGTNVIRSGTIRVTATDSATGQTDTFDVPYELTFGTPL